MQIKQRGVPLSRNPAAHAHPIPEVRASTRRAFEILINQSKRKESVIYAK